MSEAVKVREAAGMLGVARCTAYKWAREGRLPVIRFGRTLRVPLAAIERMVRDADEPREEVNR